VELKDFEEEAAQENKEEISMEMELEEIGHEETPAQAYVPPAPPIPEAAEAAGRPIPAEFKFDKDKN